MIDFTVTEVFFSENIPSMKKLTIKFIISFFVPVHYFFYFLVFVLNAAVLYY